MSKLVPASQNASDGLQKFTSEKLDVLNAMSVDPRIPADAIEITAQQFDALFNNQSTRKWQDGHVVPYEPPPPEPVVPDRLSRRQFRLALIDAGLLEQVEGWIATQDIRTQAAYADSGTFLRTDEMLQQGFAGLGFTEEQVNAFFTAASAL